MQNKKIKGSIALLAVVSVLVGGSYAWLGSTDNIINVFKTEPGKGSVEIYEHFNSEEALVMKTGENQAINKEVQIRNNSNYDSLIRVKLTPKVTDSLGNEINGLAKYVKYKYSNDISKIAVGTWVKDGEYYYYIGNIAPGYYTDKILEKVWLDPSIALDDNYKNLKDKKIKFEVKVEAEAVPSTVEAITASDGFNLTNAEIISALEAIILVDSKDPDSGGNKDKFDNDMKETPLISTE